MKLAEVSAIAKTHSIVPGKSSKSELIRSIQSKEGNFDCYATAFEKECDQGGCSWREDCFDASIREPAAG
ncbi:MAG: SAP domain-containing protein [Sideroxyarcus sp.]|nr:SAP domain-containing protein [Sideroxyarcus sp.]